jgi:hypothetical protein
MYRIQAYNKRTKHFTIHRCETMEERRKILADLLASGDYSEAGITWEWLARGWSQW